MSQQAFRMFIEFVRTQFTGVEKVVLHQPIFRGKEKAYLNEAIDSTFVSSIGQYVDQVEAKMAKLSQVRSAVAVVNGTSGLQVALKLVGVSPGEEVITQALTFVATSNAIAYNFANPVYVDVDLDTMGMSPQALERFLKEYGERRENGTYNKSTGKRLAACLPMHTFGFMCRIDEIVSICTEWGIPVVEDAAEALGSKYKERPAGSFGAIGVFSFNGNKIVTSGGGGVIVTNDSILSQKAKYLTTTAKVPHGWEYVHDELGYNFRMPNLNAALLCAQLEQLDVMINEKKHLFESYKSVSKDFGFVLKEIPTDTKWNFWLISIVLSDRKERDSFLEYTNLNGVMTRPIWQLMYRLPMYNGCQRDAQLNAEQLEERIVNIPSSVPVR